MLYLRTKRSAKKSFTSWFTQRKTLSTTSSTCTMYVKLFFSSSSVSTISCALILTSIWILLLRMTEMDHSYSQPGSVARVPTRIVYRQSLLQYQGCIQCQLEARWSAPQTSTSLCSYTRGWRYFPGACRQLLAFCSLRREPNRSQIRIRTREELQQRLCQVCRGMNHALHHLLRLLMIILLPLDWLFSILIFNFANRKLSADLNRGNWNSMDTWQSQQLDWADTLCFSRQFSNIPRMIILTRRRCPRWSRSSKTFCRRWTWSLESVRTLLTCDRSTRGWLGRANLWYVFPLMLVLIRNLLTSLWFLYISFSFSFFFLSIDIGA